MIIIRVPQFLELIGEVENVRHFGAAYQARMQHTKMFIPLYSNRERNKCGMVSPRSQAAHYESPTALGGGLGLAVARTRDSVLLHPMAKRVGVKIQDLSCALWSLNDAASPLKGSKDVTTLYLVQG